MDLFDSYRQAYPEYHEIRIVLLDGYEDVRVAPDEMPNITEDESRTDYFKQIKQLDETAVFSKYLLNPDTNQTILLVAKPLCLVNPIVDATTAKAELKAYLLITVNLDFIKHQIETNTIGHTGYLFATDAKGKVIFGSHTFSNDFQLPVPIFEQAQAINRPTLGHIDQQSFLFQAQKIDDNFILFAALPEQALLEEAYSLGFIVVSILLLTIIITIASLLLTLDYLMVNPLHELGQAFKQIEAGQLDIQLHWERKDEIGFLATQFEAMARGLSESQKLRDKAQQDLERLNQELEQRVQERTLALKTANKDLILLNQDKNEFLGIVAHDLKNPLQAIQGCAELIEMTLDTEQHFESKQEVMEFANMINVSSERMFALITNLLDVNAIEVGQMQVNLQLVDILPTLQKVVDEYAKKARVKQILIHFESMLGAEYVAYSDNRTLHQVFDNLISNAVKYSPFDGQIDIQIAKQNNVIQVKIQDQGKGLSEKEQAKLFGKFVRLSTKPTGGEHSTGLGLFIVKKLVDALHGQVWCESEVGKGSTFILTVPCRASESRC